MTDEVVDYSRSPSPKGQPNLSVLIRSNLIFKDIKFSKFNDILLMIKKKIILRS